ncbi:putative bifunctional diguanylate cyclase/phosphodiesterase [Thiocystis violascens]|uniref:Diguanylate cyclase (GGDEF) domain-containing protein n=1 Tax=Thiocystis violascens (strain ATCC 17096 / DSM 198 / 6111) TaxID=765911 RepID=I3Y8G3_THIV6|nr:EAL domain-containing protein [Thiocystis violascens]AFL73281.1 diguanylate cyclase (GGDEF) domain-containing protein [Thiocystis violascens DSM 198]
MFPLRGLGARYALLIASILLGAMGFVLALAGYFVFEGTNDLRTELTESFSSIQTAHDRQALQDSGSYLGNRLFDPLYTLDITALNEEIERIKAWLAPEAVLILDAEGRVVTDGTIENRDYARLYPLPDDLMPGEVRIETTDAGRLAHFSIGYGREIAGYARLLISDAHGRALLDNLRDRVEDAWHRFANRFFAIALISILVAIVLSLLLGIKLSVSLSRPLREMSRAVEQYAAGNLEHKLPEWPQDELGALARSLNQMANAQERAREQLMLLANYDNLTRLPNRHLFYDRLRQAISKARRGQHQIALFFLDLDRFKEINDALGHDFGDELLRQVADRLSRVVRDSDTLARMGGDEFTLIVEDVMNDYPLQAIAEKMINALADPFMIEERLLDVSVSIGIAIYPHDADGIDTLIKHADTAMYAAKGQGSGTFRFFTQEMQEAARERLSLEHGLRRAIMREEFNLHFQPLVRADDGRLIAIEALLRWSDGDTPKPTERLIAVLEETGLIAQLTHWVLREATRSLKALQEEGFGELRVCVNLSARQFQQADLLDLIDRVLLEFALPPGQLELEITESTLLDDQVCQSNATQLASRGIRLAIDDFGTGYSSLTYLKRFDVDVLKIDRSFVRDMLEDPGDAQIVAAVLALAAGLGLESVAEGVERSGQKERLSALGCNLIQGYLICRPLPLPELIDWMRAQAQHGVPFVQRNKI